MLTSIVKADIFFFISTIAVVVVSLCICIITYYLVHILRDMKALSKNIKDEGNRFIDDIQVIRQDMYDKREQVSNFFFFLSSLFRKKSKEKKTKTKL